MRILWKHLPPRLQIRYRGTVFKSSLIFRFNSLHLSNVLICSTLYFPGLSSIFETGTLLKTLKRRAELMAKGVFRYSVLATSSRNGQCLSESRWGSRFGDVICAQRYSILMTRHYPDLVSASDWLKQISQAARPIRSTTQVWVVTRHQYGISALVCRTSIRGETVGGVAKCRLFSQATFALASKTRLDELVERKVIVPVTEPTQWVSSMLAIVKPNKVRSCIS